MQFSELGLSEEILKAVEKIGFEEATEIQSKTIPLLMEGRDVIGRSHTGTGKTAAFGIPAVASIDPKQKNTVQVIVLCPTRELAMQACDELRKFSAFMPWVSVCAVYGGADIEKQIFQLKRGANIVVGTPGRVMDHISRRTLKLDGIRTIILDEADEMLNMGFREDIETILGFVPEKRQTVLFSATMPEPIMAITEQYQTDPVVVGTAEKSRTVDSVEQYYFDVPSGRKTDALQMLMLAYEPKLSMIFCKTKRMVDELTEQLVSKGFKAAGLHGDMKQSGRTGRAGKTGTAYTIASGRRQVTELMDIARYTKAHIERRELPTRDDVISAKTSAVLEKVKGYADSGKYGDYAQVLSGLEEEGYSVENLAAALLGMRISREIRTVPEFITPVKRRPESRGAGRGHGRNSVKVEISVGRQNKIAPNYILGALVDATGLAGKSFGKIDIYDKFTTVEVPEADKEHVLDSMTGTKINGHKIKVKLYEGRERHGSSRGQDRRRSPHSSAGRRSSKRYQ